MEALFDKLLYCLIPIQTSKLEYALDESSQQIVIELNDLFVGVELKQEVQHVQMASRWVTL